MNRNSKRRGLAAVAALLMFATACGDDSVTDTGDLPPAPTDRGDDVSTEPACRPDEPNCDDGLYSVEPPVMPPLIEVWTGIGTYSTLTTS